MINTSYADKLKLSDKINSDLRIRSGSIVKNKKLISFLYELMRDHMPTGKVEKLVKNIEIGYELNDEADTLYSNGWLAQYAEDLANRLL